MAEPAPTLPDRPPEDEARRVRLVIFDVDGVLTDAGVYLGRTEGGERVELKRFDIQDGLGVKLLQWAGIEVAIVSGRVSEATSLRAEELGVEECLQIPGGHKIEAVQELLDRAGVGWDGVAMLADDLPDVPVLRRVGLPTAVGNAQPEILGDVLWQTRAHGGRGAVREFCRRLLEVRGQWDRQVERYLGERGVP